jgi:hypothetical protein
MTYNWRCGAHLRMACHRRLRKAARFEASTKRTQVENGSHWHGAPIQAIERRRTCDHCHCHEGIQGRDR